LQDWERSLIMGTNTFGKGSVQHIVGPFEDSTALRITTARWYTPSGRSIDKPADMQGNDISEERTENDSLDAAQKVFTTLGPLKRTVYGEGGITPDIVIKPPELTKLETDVLSRGLNFDFVVQYTATHKNITRNFEVDDKMLRDFAVYLMEHDVEFTEQAFDSVRTTLKKRLRQDVITNVLGLKEGYRVRVEADSLVSEAISMLKEARTLQELFRIVNNN
jgi:carboxyl-terminal processing protease